MSKKINNAKYKLYVEDQGVILSPGKIGEKFFEYDGRGIREPNVYRVGEYYYMFYDGSADHAGNCNYEDPEQHLCRACLARSKDLINWEKLGPRLRCGIEDNPKAKELGFMDAYGAVSPWLFFDEEENRWKMFYVGALGACPYGPAVGIPSEYYSTCFAYAKTPGLEGIEGEWIQVNRERGKEKAVCFYKRKNKYPMGSTSAGPVIINPLWDSNKDETCKKYLMFFTSGATLGVAKSNFLNATKNWDDPDEENGWEVSDKPLIGVSCRPEVSFKNKMDPFYFHTTPENANYYYNKKRGYHFLFTNQFSMDITHCACNVVYWTKDINKWSDEHSAIIVDGTCTKDGWATGAIGFPSVVEIDEDTLAVFYDAPKGYSYDHANRHIALAYWKIPDFDDNGDILQKDGTKLSPNNI